jgi:hypothetical protein
VNRQHDIGPGKSQQAAKVLLARVARDVQILRRSLTRGDDLGPPPVQVIDQAGDRHLVAGDGPGGEDRHITPPHRYISVLPECDAGHRRERLALAAGGDNDPAAGRKVHEPVRRHPDSWGNAQMSERQSGVGRPDEAPPDKRYTPVLLGREIEDLLQPVDVGGKAAQEDA